MPASKQKEEKMWDLVNELANSGKYSGYQAIEWELTERNYSRARFLLGTETVRSRINRQCAEAVKGKTF